jgi:hypothetical protein
MLGARMRLWTLLGLGVGVWLLGSLVTVAASHAGLASVEDVAANLKATPLWFVLGLAATRRRDGAMAALAVGLVDAVFEELSGRLGWLVPRGGGAPMLDRPVAFASFVLGLFLGRALLLGYLGAVVHRIWTDRRRSFARLPLAAQPGGESA